MRKIEQWAWSHTPKLASAAVLVLHALVAHAWTTDTVHPSVTRLSQMTGKDVKTVRAGLASLIDGGLIKDTGARHGRTKRVVEWCLIWRDDDKPEAVAAPEECEQISQIAAPESGKDTPEMREIGAAPIYKEELLKEGPSGPIVIKTPTAEQPNSRTAAAPRAGYRKPAPTPHASGIPECLLRPAADYIPSPGRLAALRSLKAAAAERRLTS